MFPCIAISVCNNQLTFIPSRVVILLKLASNCSKPCKDKMRPCLGEKTQSIVGQHVIFGFKSYRERERTQRYIEIGTSVNNYTDPKATPGLVVQHATTKALPLR